MTTERRSFLKQVGAGTFAVASAAGFAQSSPGDRVIVGVIGPGGMGSNHVRHLVQRSDVEIAWVCDIDSQQFDIQRTPSQMKYKFVGQQGYTVTLSYVASAGVDSLFTSLHMGYFSKPQNWPLPLHVITWS